MQCNSIGPHGIRPQRSGTGLRYRTLLVLLLIQASVALSWCPQAHTAARQILPDTNPADSTEQLLQLQDMLFEVNRGQFDERVRYVARGSQYTTYLMSNGAMIRPFSADSSDPIDTRSYPISAATLHKADLSSVTGDTFWIRPVGDHANPQAELTTDNPLPSSSHYYSGSDSAQWLQAVPQFSRVTYQNVYPGIDLAYYAKERMLEFDYIVAPGADPSVIRTRFDGVKELTIEHDGSLSLLLHDGRRLVSQAPVIYQSTDNGRDRVMGRYVLVSRTDVRFEVEEYDLSKPLIIDPVLTYSTLHGGDLGDRIHDLAFAGDGSFYVTGSTNSTNLPGGGMSMGNSDLFVSKFDSTGNLEWSALLGGVGIESGLAIATSDDGSVWITGYSTSVDYPTLQADQATYGGSQDIVISQLDSTGNLIYSSFWGNATRDISYDIDVSGDGTVYVVGETTHPQRSDDDAMLLKRIPDTPIRMNLFGGTDNDRANGISVTDDALWISGNTDSVDFPVTDASTIVGAQDVFLIREDLHTGDRIATYLGGTSSDTAKAISTDNEGTAWVIGETISSDFPVTDYSYFQGGITDAFVTRVDSRLALLHSTLLGGDDVDSLSDIAVLNDGSVWITGTTTSSNFPTTAQAAYPTNSGSKDAFVTHLDNSARILTSTHLGGQGLDIGQAIGMAPSGDVWVAGYTGSDIDFPVVNSNVVHAGGGNDTFLSKFVPTLTPAVLDPDDGSTLVADTVHFSWFAHDTLVDDNWQLYAGSSVGSSDYFNSGQVGTHTTIQVHNLPTDGSTVYVRLWFLQLGIWNFVDTTYTAAN